MMRIGQFLIDLLRSPSAFEARPWHYLANQAGHMLVVGAIGGLILPWAIVLGIYMAWDAVQIIRFGAAPWDAAEDLGFVAAGVAAVVCSPVGLALAARFLYLQRIAFGGKVSGRNFGVSRGRAVRFNLITR